jgi:elongation factor Ts
MAEITAALVKELRDKTGAGMMDCKKALGATNGDIEAAVDWLRKNGLAAAAKKAGRVASEGLVGVATEGNKGAVVEVNAETDFVARNDSFREFVQTVSKLAIAAKGDVEKLKAATYPGGKKVSEQLTELIATIGENMTLRRAAALEVGSGVVVSYIHSAVQPGMGKIGVLVALESTGDAGKLTELGKQLAMHVAAAKPSAVDRHGIDATDLAREKNVLADQARASGKPENIIEKMVEGRLRKYYEEVCLLEQISVMDNETKVSDAVDKVSKAIGAPIKVAGFVRFTLGEGVEKEEKDFASEVAAVLKH